jgi:3-hydroxy acid dehydrogenase / malonic semialdehyde reductase
VTTSADLRTRYQSAVVTGASRGIGAAILASLAARKMTTHAIALDDVDLHRVAQETGSVMHGLDIRNRAAVEQALADFEVDVLVNNAGILPELQSFADNSLDAIDALVDINIRAALHITRLVLPGMISRNRGHVFFLGSIAGKHPTPNSAAYCATKAALHAFAEGLRCDLLGTAVRVTVVMPGRVQTRLYDDVFGGHEQAAAKLYDGFEAVQPNDIADVVCFALDAPPAVDLTVIEVLPTAQIFGGSTIAPTS